MKLNYKEYIRTQYVQILTAELKPKTKKMTDRKVNVRI